MKNRLFGVLRRARSVCAPKNAGKRIFSAFLSVCLAVNAFSVPSFAIAAWVAAGIEKVFEQIVVGWFASGCVDTILGSGDFSDWVSQTISTSVMSDNSIRCYYSEGGDRFQFSPSSSLSGDELDCAQFVCDYMNERMAINSASLYYDINANNPVDTASSFIMSTIGYSTLKEDAYNALNAYVASKAYNDLFEENELTASALESALGESFPRYYFDITDPSKSARLSFKSPERGNMSSLRKDGFTFTPFVSYTPGQTSFTSNQVDSLISFAPDYFYKRDGMVYLFSYPELPSKLYSFNYYFLTDDGNIYFSAYNNYFESGTLGSMGYSLISNRFYDVSGRYITGSSASEINNHIVSVGIVLNTEGQIHSSIPVNVKDTLTNNDFWIETGGESVSKDIANSGAENIVGGAIGMGLIGADALLTIGEDGKIAAADGIPIDKLGDILEAIQSGNLNLDSIEDYLSLISTLVGNGNLTMTEQQKILENIGAYAGAFAGDISEIKDILKEWAKAAEAEAAAENLDYDLPDVTIIDKFPFSLPFDVYYVLDLLCAEPKKPIFTIPIKTTLKVGNFRYTIDKSITLDLTTFKIGNVDMVQAVINTGVTIAFVFALIAGTRKFIWK